jgi:hypothetical protein
MIGATILRPGEKEAEGCDQWTSAPELVPAWDQETSPRLHVSDLEHPEAFHQRLVDWIMNQK